MVKYIYTFHTVLLAFMETLFIPGNLITARITVWL